MSGFGIISKKTSDGVIITLTGSGADEWFSFVSDYADPVWTMFANGSAVDAQFRDAGDTYWINIESSGKDVAFSWGNLMLVSPFAKCADAFRQIAMAVATPLEDGA